MTFRALLLATAALAPLPAAAQVVPTPPWAPTAALAAASSRGAVTSPDDGDSGEEIVVVGQKPRGSVVGDIPPEYVLGTRDIRATGATSIAELLSALGPQVGSARGRGGGGGGPVVLLNGQRISGFQEVRDLPPEALERLEILPEEVALKYGYSADQRVVNIILRRRFRSTNLRADAGAATDGGYAKGLADVSRLMIGTAGRTQVNLHGETNSALTERERGIALQAVPTQPQPADPRNFRTLVGSQRLVRGTVTVNRTVLGDASATLTAEASHTDGRSLFGLPTGSLTVPATNPFATSASADSVLRGFDGLAALTRRTYGETGRLGLSLNGQKARWRWSVTGNADLAQNVTRSDRGPDLARLQARLDANDPAFDPLGVLTANALPDDRSRSTRTSAGLDGTLNGPLATLPAGRANVTLKLGADTLRLDSLAVRAGVTNSARLGRDHGAASINLDLPVAKRNGTLGAVGSLTLNANAGVDQYSDFGTLTTIGAGANWSPANRLNFITSYTREKGAPSINQLGDPILTTPGARIFDFTQGRTVQVVATTGGNPALLADRRNVWKLGANWQPWEKTDLRLRADFVSSRLRSPVQNFYGPSAALEAAFPDRFTRDSAGNLTAVDLRPVNYDSARSDTVRIGFDFTKPLKSAAPPQALLDQIRKTREQSNGGDRGGNRAGDRGGGDRGGGSGWGGRGSGGGLFGGNQRGRIQLSLTDTITLVDRAIIRPGIAPLDFLHGGAAGSGGRSRHVVEAQGGYSNNGLGVRLTANYRSVTRVAGGTSGDLGFAPLATFDLRLFANLGENLPLVVKRPWLRGLSLRLEATNLLNERQKVRDRFGLVPLGYQADLLDPIGRTISISVRKLFLPSRFRQRSPAAPGS